MRIQPRRSRISLRRCVVETVAGLDWSRPTLAYYWRRLRLRSVQPVAAAQRQRPIVSPTPLVAIHRHDHTHHWLRLFRFNLALSRSNQPRNSGAATPHPRTEVPRGWCDWSRTDVRVCRASIAVSTRRAETHAAQVVTERRIWTGATESWPRPRSAHAVVPRPGIEPLRIAQRAPADMSAHSARAAVAPPHLGMRELRVHDRRVVRARLVSRPRQRTVYHASPRLQLHSLIAPTPAQGPSMQLHTLRRSAPIVWRAPATAAAPELSRPSHLRQSQNLSAAAALPAPATSAPADPSAAQLSVPTKIPPAVVERLAEDVMQRIERRIRIERERRGI